MWVYLLGRVTLNLKKIEQKIKQFLVSYFFFSSLSVCLSLSSSIPTPAFSSVQRDSGSTCDNETLIELFLGEIIALRFLPPKFRTSAFLVSRHYFPSQNFSTILFPFYHYILESSTLRIVSCAILISILSIISSHSSLVLYILYLLYRYKSWFRTLKTSNRLILFT